MAAIDPADVRFVEEAFWILLGRAVSPAELKKESREAGGGGRQALVMRLLTSPEAAIVRQTWMEGGAHPGGDALERELKGMGRDDVFVGRAYELLLGRRSDEGGLRHYTSALTAGNTRTSVLRSIAASDEFASHFRDIATQNLMVPRDVQLCELANPAKWDNPEWLDILAAMGLSTEKVLMHRKPYEFAQLVYGCRRLGVLRPEATIVSIGAGHELVLYWLANHVAKVVATDMYEGHWQEAQGREGDPGVLQNPDDYSTFPYRRDHLQFLKMDGRHLTLPDASFDIAYSLSSIEHFGGLEGAAESVREMARVLKRGGILALATEYVLQGPPHEETFQPAEFEELIRQPGLELVQPIDTAVYNRYAFTAVDLHKNPYQAPHMVVRFGDTVFTTVMVFLRRVN